MRKMLLVLLLLTVPVTASADDTADLRAAVKQVQAELAQAKKDRDEMLSKIVAIGDAVNQLQTENTKLQEAVQQLRAKMAFDKMRDEKPLREPKGFDLWLDKPLDGVVTAVDDKRNRIEISIGRDDGLSEGSDVTVLRDDKVIGTAVVRKLTVNRSVAEIKGEASVKVRKGDSVRTLSNDPPPDNGLRLDDLEQSKKREDEIRKLRDAHDRQMLGPLRHNS